MQMKTLALSLVLGLFMVTAMMGCGHDHDPANDHGDSHSSDSENHEAEKVKKQKSTSHKTIN
jgi:hypothetical protein